MHTSLTCSQCGLAHDIHVPQGVCTSCGRPLLAGYSLGELANSFTPDRVRARSTRSMWRFAEVLPVDGPGEGVSMGEGMTPLVPIQGRGPLSEFKNLYVKDESLNPTGSFKARGISAAMTRARALGVRTIGLPSAGNAGGAAASYAAKAQMRCVVLMPADTPAANIIEAVVAGARVVLIKGLISDCGKIVRRLCDRFGWFDLSTLKEPFRVEGKKTMGYELAFDMADGEGSTSLALPDVIFYPTGGGTGLIGMWKAFDEMQRLGWIDAKRPRMIAVQAEGCAPIVRAFQQNREFAEPFPNAQTVASGLRVPSAIGDFLMLRALRESGGTAVAVSDTELLAGTIELSRALGNFACPEAGAVWAAACRLAQSGGIRPDEKVVLFNTGTGLKYGSLFPPGDLPVLDPASADDFGEWNDPETDACRS